MKNTKPKILVVLGPTSTGKSDLAVELALKYKGEIISADSRQVYKGMDIGSGKITKKEMRGVPHYLLDVVKPNTEFSVAKYKKLAEKAISQILAKNKLPIICGGTGFYIDALINDTVLPEVPPNKELRKKLDRQSVEILFQTLVKLDPKRAGTIDKYNKVRLIRAIEIATNLGEVPEIKNAKKYNTLYFGLDLPDEILKDRIEQRLVKRLKKGMVKEVENLHIGGVSYTKLEKFGLEYKNCALFLQTKITQEQMRENILKESFQYAKRQRTWFKRNKEIVWLDPFKKGDIISIYKVIDKFIKNEK